MKKTNQHNPKERPSSVTTETTEMSRRTFVQTVTKLSSAVAAGLFCFQDFRSNAFAARSDTPCALPPPKLELRYDEKKCVACRLCEMACAQFHEGNASFTTSRNKVVIRPLLKFMGVSALSANAPGWPQPLANATFAEYSENHFCRQCASPECLDACPENAIFVHPKTGARVVDPEKCVGCGECVEACQFDMIWLNDDTEKAFKCDLCGGEPQCARWCPSGAITVKRL